MHFDHFFVFAGDWRSSVCPSRFFDVVTRLAVSSRDHLCCHVCCLGVLIVTWSVQLCPFVLSRLLFGSVDCDFECPVVSTCVLFATLCRSTRTFLSTAHHLYLEPGIRDHLLELLLL